MLESPDLEFIMEAHSGMSAKIVQEAGDKWLPSYLLWIWDWNRDVDSAMNDTCCILYWN